MTKNTKPGSDSNTISGGKRRKLAREFPDFYRLLVGIKEKSKDDSGFVLLPNILLILLLVFVAYLIQKVRQISAAVGPFPTTVICFAWFIAIMFVIALIRDCASTHSAIEHRGQLIVSSIVHLLYIIVLLVCTTTLALSEPSSSTFTTIIIYLCLCGSEYFCTFTHLWRDKDEKNDCSWFAETTIIPLMGIIFVLLYTFVDNLTHESIFTSFFDFVFCYLLFTYTIDTFKRFIRSKSDNDSSNTA